MQLHVAEGVEPAACTVLVQLGRHLLCLLSKAEAFALARNKALCQSLSLIQCIAAGELKQQLSALTACMAQLLQLASFGPAQNVNHVIGRSDRERCNVFKPSCRATAVVAQIPNRQQIV